MGKRNPSVKLLKAGQVAKALEIHPRTARNWILEGRFGNYHRFGREIRISEDAVERYVDRHRVEVFS